MNMEMNIGFGKDEKYVSTSLPQLKAWEIHDVEFDGFEYSKFSGRKDPTAEYEVLRIKFKNDEGQFAATLFAPKPGDEKRTTRKNANGHEVENPSNLEVFTKTIGHVLTAISPDTLTKLAGKSVSFEKLCAFLKKETDSKIGTKTKIKLIGDSNGKPRLPYMLSIFENGGEAVITNNCIGDKLGFTAYELDRKAAAANAKPTNMPNTQNDTAEAGSPVKEEASDDLDWNL